MSGHWKIYFTSSSSVPITPASVTNHLDNCATDDDDWSTQFPPHKSLPFQSISVAWGMASVWIKFAFKACCDVGYFKFITEPLIAIQKPPKNYMLDTVTCLIHRQPFKSLNWGLHCVHVATRRQSSVQFFIALVCDNRRCNSSHDANRSSLGILLFNSLKWQNQFDIHFVVVVVWIRISVPSRAML